jgi:pSer/pThr/pTyr-binding forkhead associated (FHA) protein
MATLVVTTGERRGEYYPLGHRTNVVGRGESLPIQILDDRVSRKHVQIRFDCVRGRYWAVDMASKNGVFVNGVKIAAETLLHHRDRIRLGGTLLLFIERDFASESPTLHRFKRAGECRRTTDFDWQPEPQHLARPVSTRCSSLANR